MLTVNDPVSLDSVEDHEAGEVSGVSATAEQAGGAIGIAALYTIFHTVYVHRLDTLIDAGPGHGLTAREGQQLKEALQAAEQTGLKPHHFDPTLVQFLKPAAAASDRGYVAAYLAVTVVALIGMAVVARLVRRPAVVASETTEVEVTEVEVAGTSEADGAQR